MTVGIYGWFDRENDQCLYIGQSCNIESRKSSHLKKLRNGKHARKDFAEYYQNKENKDDIYLEILEVTEDNLDIKNAAEIKWFNLLKPLFYGMEPDETYYCFTPTKESRKNSSETVKNTNNKSSKPCIECTKNLTYRRDGICISCKEKENDKIIKEKRKYNKENNITFSDLEIIEMYIGKDMSYREISLETGLSSTTVGKIIKRNYIKPKGHGYISKQRETGFRKRTNKICLYCNKEFFNSRERQYCSRKCADNMKREDGEKHKKENNLVKKDGTAIRYGEIPRDVKKRYYDNFTKEELVGPLSSHGRYHYGKDMYDYKCILCQYDNPVNKENEKWKSQEYIADSLGITKNQLGGLLLRNGLKTVIGDVTALSRKTSNLFCILPTTSLKDALWDINKVTKLYNSGN